MMARFLLLSSVFLLCVSEETCTKKAGNTVYKGRLEIAGICQNYTISLLKCNMDTSLLASEWKDEITGKEYTHVFKPGSPCTFPSTIRQGDSFYFTIDHQAQNCQVCMAYYPTPPKSLHIKVIQP